MSASPARPPGSAARGPGRDDRDLGQLLGRGAVLVHVTGGDQRVVAPIRVSPYGASMLSAELGGPRPDPATGADHPRLAARCRAVGQQRDLGLARGDVARRRAAAWNSIGAAADVGGVDHPRGEAEVLGDRRAPDRACLAGVVQRVDVGPGQPGVLERPRRALGLDLQRAQAPGDPLGELVDARDGRGRGRHYAAANCIWPRSMTTAPVLGRGPERGGAVAVPPDRHHQRVTGQHRPGEPPGHGPEPGRVRAAQRVQQRAPGEPVGAQAVQDRPAEPAAGRERRVRVQRVPVAGQPVQQRLFRPGGHGHRVVRRAGWAARPASAGPAVAAETALALDVHAARRRHQLARRSPRPRPRSR